MPRISRTALRALAPALLLSTLPAAAGPAYAAPNTVTASSGVAFRDCFGQKVAYSLTPGSDTWVAGLTARDGSGSTIASASLGSSAGDPAQGSVRLTMCSPKAGTYTVKGTLTWIDGSGSHEEAITSSSAKLRKPRSRITLAAKPLHPRVGQQMSVYLYPKLEFPDGYRKARLGDGKVRLQARPVGKSAWDWASPWYDVVVYGDRAKGTNQSTRKYDLRWKYHAPKAYQDSTSDKVRIAPR